MVNPGKLGQIVIFHSMTFDRNYLLNQHSEEISRPLQRNYKSSGLYQIVIEDGKAKVIDTSKTR